MSKEHAFAREESLPSWFLNVLQEYVSGQASDVRLALDDPTTVTVIPRVPVDIAVVNVQGRYRWRTTPVVRAHPGGPDGTYAVWAVATDTAVDNIPDPFTDHTVYDFDLRITNGADPAGAGVEIFEKIGEVDWEAGAIVALRQTYGSVTGALIDAAALVAPGLDLDIARTAEGALEFSSTPWGQLRAYGDNVSIPNNAWTEIPMTHHEYNQATDRIDHSAVVGNADFTMAAGIFHLLGAATFDVSPNGLRRVRLVRNGVEVIAEDVRNAASGGNTSLSVPREIMCDDGDTVRLEVFQSSGGALDVLQTRGGPSLAAHWLGPHP